MCIRDRVGVDPPGGADADPPHGVLDHHVEGDQAAEGVLVRGGEEDRALEQLARENRRLDLDRADLGGSRAAGPEGGRELFLGLETGRAASTEALGLRAVSYTHL